MIDKNKEISKVTYNGTVIPLKSEGGGGGAVPEMGKYNAYYLEYSSATGKYEPTLIGGIKGGDVITLKQGSDVAAANTGTEMANPDLVFDEWSSPIEIVNNTITIPERISSDVYIGATYHPADGKWHYITSVGDDMEARPYGYSVITRVFVPSGQTYIPSFADEYSLIAVTLPKGLTTIGDGSFSYCSALSALVIPKGVTVVGNNVCEQCTALDYVVMPSGITEIKKNAFSGSALKQVFVPQGVTSIGSEAFMRCLDIKNMTLMEGLTILEVNAFNCLSALSYLSLPEGLTTLGYGAVSECAALVTLVIPSTVESIGDVAFYYAQSLMFVYLKPTSAPTLGAEAFDYVNESCYFYAVNSSAYRSETNWSNLWIESYPEADMPL